MSKILRNGIRMILDFSRTLNPLDQSVFKHKIVSTLGFFSQPSYHLWICHMADSLSMVI